MSIAQILQLAVKRLKNRNIVSTELDAELLLASVLACPREYVLAHPEFKLSARQLSKFKNLLKRRINYEPIAYILGKKDFFGLELKVNKNVLIPRPETETVVETALDFIRSNRLNKIIDVGTGSGAIALALKKVRPRADVLAVDDSASALIIAKQNARRYELKIKFIKSDLLSRVSDAELQDSVIVANLPYLSPATIKRYSPVLKRQLAYEPQAALYAGRYGIDAYENLFQQLAKRLAKPRAVFCEIGPCHWRKYYQTAKKYFVRQKVEVKSDLAGKKRCLIIYY
ncbi:MAG: peptide chain release factor N(5)-glutamine methyltransferase [Patescibacteria group bacterium]|jgi:release factor glutamine methyltransferase